MAQFCLDNGAFGYDSSTLVVDIGRVSDNSEKFCLGGLAGCLVGHDCRVSTGYTYFYGSAPGPDPSLFERTQSCLGWLCTGLVGAFTAPGSLSPTSWLSLVLTTMTLRQLSSTVGRSLVRHINRSLIGSISSVSLERDDLGLSSKLGRTAHGCKPPFLTQIHFRRMGLD